MKKLLLLALGALASTQAFAQVTINFSGGGGSPLTVTLPHAITFTRTDDDTKGSLYFIIPSLSSAGGNFNTINSTLAAEVDGGAPLALNSIQINFGGNGITFGNVGISTYNTDTVVLSAGSFTTVASYAGTFTSGTYNIYLMDSASGDVESAAAVNYSAVPEPSTYAAIFGALALGAVGVVRQRRRAAVAQN